MSSTYVRCAIYTRVSCEEQTRGDFTSCDAQEHLCKQFILTKAAQGWRYAQTYTDPAVSGRKLSRPALNALTLAASRKLIDVVVVLRRDRFSRVVKNTVQLEALLERNGVAVFSVDEPRRGKSASDKFARNVKDAANEYETDMLIERIRAKNYARASVGLPNPGKPSYGYRYDRVTKGIYVVPEEAEVVRQIFSLAVAGNKVPAITSALREKGILKRPFLLRSSISFDGKRVLKHRPFTADDIYRILTHSVYRGMTRARNPLFLEAEDPTGVPEFVEFKAKHEAIIDSATWSAAQQATVKSGRKPRGVCLTQRDKHGYLLKGLLVCGSCQCHLTTSFANKRRPDGSLYRYYKCTRLGKEGEACGCDVRMVPADAMESAVLAYIHRIVVRPELIKQTLDCFASNSSSKVEISEARLASAKAKEKELTDTMRSFLLHAGSQGGALASFAQDEAEKVGIERRQVLDEILRLEDEVQHLRTMRPEVKTVRDALSQLSDLIGNLDAANQKQLLAHVCERIEVSRPVTKDYLTAVQNGRNPRMFRVQLLLATDGLQSLENAQFDGTKPARPRANFELGFTIEFPLTRGRVPFRITDSDGVVEMEAFQGEEAEPDVANNVVVKALEWQAKAGADSGLSGRDVAKLVGVSPATFSLHMKVLKQVDPWVLSAHKACRHLGVLKHFSLRAFLRLAELPQLKQRDQYRQEAAAAKLSNRKPGIVLTSRAASDLHSQALQRP